MSLKATVTTGTFPFFQLKNSNYRLPEVGDGPGKVVVNILFLVSGSKYEPLGFASSCIRHRGAIADGC